MFCGDLYMQTGDQNKDYQIINICKYIYRLAAYVSKELTV